jgi:hypothetical protein
MAPVPRVGRILDLVGLLFLLAGGGLVGRAWVGFREVQGFVPPPDAPAMAAVAYADRFWRLQKVGAALMALGLAVFLMAWWVARKSAASAE